MLAGNSFSHLLETHVSRDAEALPDNCWQGTAFHIYLKRMFLEMQRRCLTCVLRCFTWCHNNHKFRFVLAHMPYYPAHAGHGFPEKCLSNFLYVFKGQIFLPTPQGLKPTGEVLYSLPTHAGHYFLTSETLTYQKGQFVCI